MRAKRMVLICVGVLWIVAGFRSGPTTGAWEFPQLKFFPPLPPGTPTTLPDEGVELGRYLFYDPILSFDSSISCSSCHVQKYAFSDSPKVFSEGAGKENLKRNTPPLFNLAWYRGYFWDGRASSLQEQVYASVRAKNEMNLTWKEAEQRVQRSPFYRKKFQQVFGTENPDSVSIATAIAWFEITLLSHNSKYDRVIRREETLNAQEYLGFNLMNDQTRGDCLHCHTTDGDALGTTGGYSNNGLDAVYSTSGYIDAGRGAVTGLARDAGMFKIPSLRNVAITAPYMHDGRFATLEEVLDFYSTGVHASANIDSKMEFAHRGGAHLTETEKAAILAMLYALTDSVFIADPRFSNPFTQ